MSSEETMRIQIIVSLFSGQGMLREPMKRIGAIIRKIYCNLAIISNTFDQIHTRHTFMGVQ